MSNTFFGLSVDCDDAATLARFWADVLGREVAADPDSDNAVVTVDAVGVHGPRLAFHRVPEPKTVKNRLHLDLVTAEFDAETERLLGLGATRIRDVAENGANWTTFADIEGNEFDVIAAA
ncbi:MAG TPA: VOC family protein [Pseudonocardiaceae bacterium]